MDGRELERLAAGGVLGVDGPHDVPIFGLTFALPYPTHPHLGSYGASEGERERESQPGAKGEKRGSDARRPLRSCLI